jgi:uridine monophosphate synthetase
MGVNDQQRLEELLEAFWAKGLVLFGERVEREYALQTPIFIDLRHKLYDDLTLLSVLGRQLHQALVSIIQKEAPGSEPSAQQVIGVPDTATPLALSLALVSHSTEMPFHYGQMRKRPAAYPGGTWGTSAYMGTKNAKREITLIDDVMASGRTKLWAIDELKKDGLEVARVLVVVDREQGGDAILAEQGCPCHSLFKISELVGYYQASGKIDSQTARSALEHLKSKQFR